MARPSELRIAQISIGPLVLVIIRRLGEYFRLQYLHGEALVIGQVTPFVAGALFAAIALALMLTCYVVSLYRVGSFISGQLRTADTRDGARDTRPNSDEVAELASPVGPVASIYIPSRPCQSAHR